MSIPAHVETPAQALLSVAAAVWSAAGGEQAQTPVLWLQGTSGSLVVYTPGPYAQELLQFVKGLGARPESAPASDLDRWLDSRCCE